MSSQKKEVKSFGTESETKKEEIPNNTNLGLQMTGFVSTEGKTPVNQAEMADIVTEENAKKEAEAKKKEAEK